MRISELKGIANNLCSHLDSQFTFGRFKKLKVPLEIDVLTDRSPLAKHCWKFIKEKINEPERIKKITLTVHRKTLQTFKLIIKVDNKEVIGRSASLCNPGFVVS